MKRVGTWLLIGAATASTILAGSPVTAPWSSVRSAPQVETLQAHAVKKEAKNPLVESARKYLGVPYEWGGRLGKTKGLDCLGLMYAVIQEKYHIAWHRWSTTPFTLIHQLDKTGKNTKIIVPGCDSVSETPVHGQHPSKTLQFPPLHITPVNPWGQAAAFSGTSDTSSIDTSALKQLESEVLGPLKSGDLLFFLSSEPSGASDIPVARDKRKHNFYVKHTGMYADSGNFIHASHPDFKDKWGISASSVCEENLVDFLERNGYSGIVAVTYVSH